MATAHIKLLTLKTQRSEAYRAKRLVVWACSLRVVDTGCSRLRGFRNLDSNRDKVPQVCLTLVLPDSFDITRHADPRHVSPCAPLHSRSCESRNRPQRSIGERSVAGGCHAATALRPRLAASQGSLQRHGSTLRFYCRLHVTRLRV